MCIIYACLHVSSFCGHRMRCHTTRSCRVRCCRARCGRKRCHGKRCRKTSTLHKTEAIFRLMRGGLCVAERGVAERGVAERGGAKQGVAERGVTVCFHS